MKRAAIPCALVALSALVVAISLRVGALLDDGFISFVYVKNLLHGHGLTYNGTVVQGYTNPLWVLLLSALGYLGADIPTAAIWLGEAAAIAAIAATYWLGRQLRLPPAISLIPAALLVLSVDLLIYIGSGLETVLFAALLTTVVACLCAPRLTMAYAAGGGAAAGLLALCRPEGLAVIVGGTIYLGLRRLSRPTGVFLLVAAAFAAPWFLWAHSFYGDWLPNSFYARSAELSLNQARSGLQYLADRLHLSGALALGALMAALGLGAVRRSHPHARATFVVVTMWLAYVVTVGGDFMPGFRLFVPVLGIALVGVLAVAWSMRSGRRLLPVGLAATAVAFSLLRALDPQPRAGTAWCRRVGPWLDAIGLYLHEHAAPGSLVATSPAGKIAYYSELPTIDMLGINDYHIARHGHRDASVPIGHQVGDGAYVLSRRPDYVLLTRTRAFGFIPVTDRELMRSHEFRRCYRLRLFMLPQGGQFECFVRNDDPRVAWGTDPNQTRSPACAKRTANKPISSEGAGDRPENRP